HQIGLDHVRLHDLGTSRPPRCSPPAFRFPSSPNGSATHGPRPPSASTPTPCPGPTETPLSSCHPCFELACDNERNLSRRRRSGRGRVVGGRGDRQHSADRLNPNASRWASMNSTITEVGGRARPRRTPTPKGR